MKTRVTELLGIRYPIVQGGLAYLAYSELAAAVSNAGGLGQITAMTLKTKENLTREIHKVKALTFFPFGVNFAVGGQTGTSYEELLEVAITEQVPVVSITGANPAPIIEKLKGTSIKTLVLVSNVRQAQKAEELGADAVMAVGQEAGGHIGRDDLGTMVLIPRVAQAVSIPVLASGGIGNGQGLLAAFALGAEGIEMGTRFIATKECVHAGERYKQAIVEGTERDTIVIKRSLGAPGRVLKSDYTLSIVEREHMGDRYEELQDVISGKANCRYIYENNEKEGFGWAGQVIGLISTIPTVQELFNQMIEEYETARHRVNQISQ